MNIIDILMASTEGMTPSEKIAFQEERKRKIAKSLSMETEAISVIKAKIRHYKQTGKSPFKLKVYEDKLKDKEKLLGRIKSWLG